jgi:hypothetical protein
MKSFLKNIISGFGSLLDLSGEYENVEVSNKGQGFKIDAENIESDFQHVGDHIKHSMKLADQQEGNQMQFDFETDVSKNENNAVLSH